MPEQVQGVLEHVVHRNQDDNFFIGSLDNGTTVVGSLSGPKIGVSYEFMGGWVNHPTFGHQFKFTSCVPSVPTTKKAAMLYLEKHAKWLGDVRSKKIIELYGDNALQVCKDDPERLTEDIPGITLPRAQEISKALRLIEGQERIELALNVLLDGLKVSTKVRNRMTSQYGDDILDVIKNTPYDLLSIKGMGFPTPTMRVSTTDLPAGVYALRPRPKKRMIRRSVICGALLVFIYMQRLRP